MAEEPTYYNINPVDMNGMNQADLVKIVYNLWKAVSAICINIDTTSGVLNSYYRAAISTDLNTAMAGLQTPRGSST
jgi:hypothetical protein